MEFTDVKRQTLHSSDTYTKFFKLVNPHKQAHEDGKEGVSPWGYTLVHTRSL